jgi:hypothetical protein
MLKFAIFLCVADSLLVCGAPASIGFAKSVGDFLVDGSAVSGNGTIFEGTLVETAAARSVIQLADAQITLAPESRLRVYRNRAVLEKGSGSLRDGNHYIIEAATLRIAPLAKASIVQVDLAGPLALTVAASGGPTEVRNSSDVLTASVLPGMALAFEPQEAASSVVKISGVVESRDGAYFLTDETTKVTVQLVGPNVSKYVGKMVRVTGSSVPDATPAGGATQLVRIVAMKPIAAGSAAAAGTGGAGTGAGAGAGSSAGLSIAAIGAIVGGVAVAGTVGGLAAAGTFSGSSVSRP